MSFRAIVIEQTTDRGRITEHAAKLRELDDDFLTASGGERPIDIEVEYSDINYKDGMAIAGRPGIVKASPLIPGIDLVGRVVSVSEWSADVSVIGAPGSGVGVRTGSKGVIGTLSGSDPTTAHGADELVITQLTRDRVRPGDAVTTLGSPGSRPYPPGVAVGEVARVDRAPGRLTHTAVVRPAVDLATVDVVAVVTGPGRTSRRTS